MKRYQKEGGSLNILQENLSGAVVLSPARITGTGFERELGKISAWEKIIADALALLAGLGHYLRNPDADRFRNRSANGD
jgi:hypothetical protein